MNGFQKVIKIGAICLAIFLIVNIFSWMIFGISCFVAIIEPTEEKISESEKAEELLPDETRESIVYTENEYKDIEKIDIDTKYGELYIKTTTNPDITIKVDNSNTKFDVRLANGILKVKERDRSFFNVSKSGKIDIYIPENFEIKELQINSGAGKTTIMDIKAREFDIDHGARKARNSKL